MSGGDANLDDVDFEVPMSTDQVRTVKELFDFMDVNGNGFVTWRDVKYQLGQFGIKRSSMASQEIVHKYSIDDNGLIPFNDFLLFYAEVSKDLTSIGELKEAWKILDTKTTGRVPVPRLIQALKATNVSITDAKINQLMRSGFPQHRMEWSDWLANGEVTYDEFVNFLYN
jgi:Ca2+-binding EF-hand superfamily protein